MLGNGGRRLACLLLGGIGFLTVTGTGAAVTVSDPGTYVVDRADLIDPAAEQGLERWLAELERKTTAQVKVLTVPTTEGEDFFTFVHRHAESWHLGQKGKDNGALIALALEEHQVRVHTGYGLEGIMPDSWVGTLSRAGADRYFKQGAYSEGLSEMTIAVATKVADAQQVELTGMPKPKRLPAARGTPGASFGLGLLPLLLMFFIISSIARRRRYRSAWAGGGMAGGFLLGSLLGGSLAHRRSHWQGSVQNGFGGGFGGGLGGTFGGGGSFGGGGGGASW